MLRSVNKDAVWTGERIDRDCDVKVDWEVDPCAANNLGQDSRKYSRKNFTAIGSSMEVDPTDISSSILAISLNIRSLL